MGIRRRFSSLSGNNGAIPSSTSSSQANHSKTSAKSTVATNSTPSLLIPQKSSKTSPKIESDENGNNLEENEGAEKMDGGFDMATNLEAYKQRCRALEAENRRLMNNQGKLIQDSNRRMDVHLEEMRQLKEAMEQQKRENVELAHWAKRLEGDSSKAKELAREWQRVGQFNNRLIQRELQCYQTRVEQLEMKCVKLTGENVELKRLCLYLDKQRQTLWQQLAQKNAEESGEHSLPAADQQQNPDGGERGEFSSGCGSSAVSTPSTSNSVNSLEDGGLMTTVDGKRSDKAGGNNDNLSGNNQIHVDGKQEKTLQSICSEMMQSSMLLGQLEMANPTDEVNKIGPKRENVSANGHRRIVSPKILDYYDGEEEQFVQANLVKTLPPTVQFDEKCNIENNVLEQSGIESSGSSENSHNITSSTSPCSSSFGTTAQFGSSFCSSTSADDTAILVLDMDEHGQNGTLLHHLNSLQIQNANANLNGLGGLEVRELCTISEEEGDEGEDGPQKLMKMEQLERMKLKHGGGAGEDDSKESILEELLIRRRTTTTGQHQLAAINATTNGGNLSLSSSLLAQAGSMLTSMMDDTGPYLKNEISHTAAQMSRSAAQIFLQQSAEGTAMNGGNGGGNNRNSSTSTGSSTSSGAFSGTSGNSSNETVGRGMMELFGEPDGDDDYLPPQMPLISQTHHRLLPSIPKNIRPASCLEATNIPSNSIPSIPSSTQQRSTLPRAAATNNFLPNEKQLLNRPSSVIGQQQQMQQRPMHPPDYSSLNNTKSSGISPRPNKKMTMASKGPPVRIRVRPPPIVQTNFPPMEHKIVKNVNSNSNSLDHPQPFPLHLSMPKMKASAEADVTSL